MFNQRWVVGCYFARARRRGFQERVTRAQGTFVGTQSRPITSIDLRAEKIQVTASPFRSTAHQFDVGIGQRNHAPDAQIFAQCSLLDLVKLHPTPQRAEAKLKFVLFESAADFEKFLTDLDYRYERRRALRL